MCRNLLRLIKSKQVCNSVVYIVIDFAEINLHIYVQWKAASQQK